MLWRERWIPSEETTNLILAGFVGAVAALVNLTFYSATEFLKWVGFHQTGDPVEIARELAPVWRLAVPLAGALAAGAILQWGQRLARGDSSTNLLEVVVAGDGRLPLRQTFIKALSSLVSIFTGASIGREGPITQISAALASKSGDLVALPPYRLRLLLACGAAGGMAAAYNAPIAGAVFAAQIVLGNFAMNLFAPLICSSVTAAVLSRSFFGLEPSYRVTEFDFTSLSQLPWFLVLGVLAGGLGATFLRLLDQSEMIFRRTGWPLLVRLGVAGLIVGVLAAFSPAVWGNGYGTASRILQSDAFYVGWVLVGVFLAKFVATLAAVGSGTVGGVFTPTLFLGVSLGALFGSLLHSVGLAESLPTGTFALVGMGSLLAATTHSPLLAMIMLVEISLNYSLAPPIMLACAVGTLVSRRLHPSSVYTEPLRRKGLLPEAESEKLGAAIQRTVGDLMLAPVPPLSETSSFAEITDRFLTGANNFLPVVNSHHQLVGLVALQDLKEYLHSSAALPAVIALDVMRPPPPIVTPGQKIEEALPVILASDLRSIPVVSDPLGRRLVGNLPRSEALALLTEALAPSRR